MAPASFFSDGVFSGDRALFGTDFRFAWAPTGNARQSQLIFQGEYLWQTDDGAYTLADDEMEEHELATDGRSAGWYAQAVYKFAPEWRIGARYARLSPPSAAQVDHDPSALAIMGDWTSDRFGQLRLQYKPGIAGARRGGRSGHPAIHGELGRPRRSRPLGGAAQAVAGGRVPG